MFRGPEHRGPGQADDIRYLEWPPGRCKPFARIFPPDRYVRNRFAARRNRTQTTPESLVETAVRAPAEMAP